MVSRSSVLSNQRQNGIVPQYQVSQWLMSCEQGWDSSRTMASADLDVAWWFALSGLDACIEKP